jgi:hypothetical protein
LAYLTDLDRKKGTLVNAKPFSLMIENSYGEIILQDNLVIQKALGRFYEDEIPNKIPESLPLVEEFCKSKLAPEIFADMDVLFIQHHLGPLIPRIHAMFNHGLEASRCWFVDIPYSTNNCVREELKKMGCPENQMARPFNDPIAPYSMRQCERVEHMIKLLANHDSTRILVVDDGAYFIRALNHLLFRDKGLIMHFKKRDTYVVEQTTRGHRYLEKKDGEEMLTSLNMPVVSIARARTKYDLESPFIGAAVSRGMIHALKKSGRLANGLGRVLVIGFGAVGQATTRELSKLKLDKPIEVYDIKKKLKKEIEKTGAHALKTFPKKGPYDTVFGCTGYASINTVRKLRILARNAVLVSGSSAAIEFNREKFIDRAYKRDKDNFSIIEPEKTRNAGIHATINMQLENNKFSFLNAGFPVNFDGRLECLPYLIIQITHGMLIAAAQETLGKQPGLHYLNHYDDDWFYKQGLQWIERYSKQEMHCT